MAKWGAKSRLALGLCGLTGVALGLPMRTIVDLDASVGEAEPGALGDVAEAAPRAEVELVEAADTDATEADLPDIAALALMSFDAPTPEIESDHPTGPGYVLPNVPDYAPGAPPAAKAPTLNQIRDHLVAGDTHRALRGAEAFVAKHKSGRERDAAWMLIGMLHREQGRHNLASEAFTKVRVGNGPLGRLAAWYEAEQDLARGKGQSAVRECTKYRETWPEGEHAWPCLRVVALGEASVGHTTAARKAADEYDEEHPKAPITEQVELALAVWEAEHAPQRGIPHLKSLALSHRAALTGRVAEELLARLAAAGAVEAFVPDDTASLQQRAVSLREAARKDDAWAAYQELIRRSSDDPELAEWVEAVALTFGWRTHRWDFLADVHKARYEAEPNADDAWEAHRVLGRGGRWQDAAAWARIGLKQHGGTREWRGKEEEIARTFLLASAFGEARDLYDTVARRGGVSGRRAEFYAAFAQHRAANHADAIARFTTIVDRGREYDVEARYWRAKSYDGLGRTSEAAADRQWIAANDPFGWYGILVTQSDSNLPLEAPFARNGRWPGPELPQLQPSTRLELDGPVAPAAWTAPRLVDGGLGFVGLTWPLAAAADHRSEPLLPVTHRNLLAPPPSYEPGALFDPIEATARFKQLADDHGDSWTSLPAIRDLCAVGLYDLAGPMFSAFYEDWRNALRRGSASAREASRPNSEWRQLFLYARDHHHTARFVYGLEDEIDDPATQLAAAKLGWPLAHDRYVWAHAREHDVDPYLVLGLMRQESTYNSIAVSPVGARGAMQIMPRTGHLLADVRRDTSYTAGDLEDPVLSVGYGIGYLGLLLDRFGGAMPLAVASYNGGPHNVSSWLAGTGVDVPTDVFVESIPFRETRDYVKRVSSNYATYLVLYAPEGSRVRLDPGPAQDDRAIVDF